MKLDIYLDSIKSKTFTKKTQFVGMITLAVITSAKFEACSKPLTAESATSESIEVVEETSEQVTSPVEYVSVKVKKGDTLSEIALKYGATVEEVKRLNNITDANKIKSGTTLIVPVTGEVYETISVSTPTPTPTAKPVTTESKDYTKITVKKGDTLGAIAIKYGTTIAQLKEINGIKNANKIKVGDTLLVPAKEITLTATEKPVSTIETKPSTKPIEVTIDNDWDAIIAEQGYVKGIDISQLQRNMDLGKVLDENKDIKFVMARSFYFQSEKADTKFEEFCRICAEKGVAVGTYYWPTLKSVDEAKEQVGKVLDKIRKLEAEGVVFTMPIALDVEPKEDQGGGVLERLLAKDEETQKALIYTIEKFKQEGYEVVFYSNDGSLKDLQNKYKNSEDENLYSNGRLFGIDCWGAKYKYNKTVKLSEKPKMDALKYTGETNIRQYAATGSISGYNGDVDLDVCYINYPKYLKEQGLNNIPQEEEKSLFKKFVDYIIN